MEYNELLLLSKNDLPFAEAQINIHQPTINEISFIGEENFVSGCNFLNFSKAMIKDADKSDLENKSDFEIFMSIMNNKNALIYRNKVLMVLSLLFPTAKIEIDTTSIILITAETMARIDASNFNAFKEILVLMFDLQDESSGLKYNPADKRAEKIAEKLKKRKQKLNNSENTTNNRVAIFSRFVSILAVGEGKDINTLMEYTVFQLKDEMKRYQKKQSFDMYMQAKMAGAQDLEEVDNWMEDIHS